MNLKLFSLALVIVLMTSVLFSAPPSSDGPYDRSTGAMMTVDYTHHEIHAGSHFFYTDSVELTSAASQSYIIQTPPVASSTKRAHLIITADGSAITQFQLYEASDRNGVATATSQHSQREFVGLATSVVSIFKGVASGTTDGTLIWTYKGGAAAGASRTPVSIERDQELVLKPDTKYHLRVTSGTASNLTNVQFHWYEHTAKEN